ncbi:hypothetical protein [Streptomyces sp. MJM1172]|uniref:hypothetical protein n=1 Tax=Streptomyces sp. MJM1172 TaxID=1703926 RepID=UPI0018E9A485|nr:hypothetical protein [Streptomyces sp. MJM1172]
MDARNRCEQHLFERYPYFVHAEALSASAHTPQAISGRHRTASIEDQQSRCVCDHNKWTRARTHRQPLSAAGSPRPALDDVLHRSWQGAQLLPLGGFRPELDAPLPDVVDQALDRLGRV